MLAQWSVMHNIFCSPRIKSKIHCKKQSHSQSKDSMNFVVSNSWVLFGFCAVGFCALPCRGRCQTSHFSCFNMSQTVKKWKVMSLGTRRWDFLQTRHNNNLSCLSSLGICFSFQEHGSDSQLLLVFCLAKGRWHRYLTSLWWRLLVLGRQWALILLTDTLM